MRATRLSRNPERRLRRDRLRPAFHLHRNRSDRRIRERIGKVTEKQTFTTAYSTFPERGNKHCSKSLRLLFAAVDEQAWVYVNGKLVREHSEKSEGKSVNDLWEEPFTADVPPECLNYGQANVLAVRVSNSTANGGIWRPVLGHAVNPKE